MKNSISEALSKASPEQLKSILGSILSLYAEDCLDSYIEKSKIRNILLEEDLSIPGGFTEVSYEDRMEIKNELRNSTESDPEILIDLLTDIIQRAGRLGNINQKELQDLLSDFILVSWTKY